MVEAPKLGSLEFDGKLERHPFFESQVAEARRGHSDFKILAHLKGKLKGKPFQAVSASLLTGGTLDDIWESKTCCENSH